MTFNQSHQYFDTLEELLIEFEVVSYFSLNPSPVWTLQSSWSPPRNNNSSLASPMLPPLHTAVELTDHEGFTKIGTHRINFISDGVRQQPYWDILSLSLYLAMVMQAESIAAAAAARETWLGEEQRNSLLARWCWRSWLYCYEGLHSLVESARKSSSMTTCPILWSGYSRTLELIPPQNCRANWGLMPLMQRRCDTHFYLLRQSC